MEVVLLLFVNLMEQAAESCSCFLIEGERVCMKDLWYPNPSLVLCQELIGTHKNLTQRQQYTICIQDASKLFVVLRQVNNELQKSSYHWHANVHLLYSVESVPRELSLSREYLLALSNKTRITRNR